MKITVPVYNKINIKCETRTSIFHLKTHNLVQPAVFVAIFCLKVWFERTCNGRGREIQFVLINTNFIII